MKKYLVTTYFAGVQGTFEDIFIFWVVSSDKNVLIGTNASIHISFFFFWFYAQEHRQAQPAVVLVLKHLRRLGHSLKSHSTD